MHIKLWQFTGFDFSSRTCIFNRQYKKIILKANQDTQVIVMLQLLVFLDILFIEYQSLQFFVCYLVITLMKLNGDIVLFFLLVFAPHLDQHDYQCNQNRLG